MIWQPFSDTLSDSCAHMVKVGIENSTGVRVDIGDSPEEAAFRTEAVAWLSDHANLRSAGERRAQPVTAKGQAEHAESCREWQRTLYNGGWAGIAWPKQFGGRGAKGVLTAIFEEEQAKFDVPTGVFAVAFGMVGPTLMKHGTDDQRKHLDDILKGDEVWCQLFSEPDAGSDLASLATIAERDGDDWVVTGQKVWTSMAQHSDYGILLARTNPDVPKHAGITYFLVDMKSPGIVVKPLVQMTGIAHFNETFLDEVRVPNANVVGEAGEGWKVAQTTLSNERAFIGGSSGAWTIDDLIDLARSTGKSSDPIVRQQLAQAYSRVKVLAYMGYRLRTAASKGQDPGPVVSTLKLFYSRHIARTTSFAVGLLGAQGTLWGSDAVADGLWQQQVCSQYAVRLGGGTDEVQGNVIGERALGLPREPSADRDLTWRQARAVKYAARTKSTR